MTLGIYLQQDDPGFTVHASSLEAGLTCDECGWRVWFQSKPLFEIARKAAEHGRQHGRGAAGLTANSGDGGRSIQDLYEEASKDPGFS